MYSLQRRGASRHGLAGMKRLLDVVVALLALILLSPVLAITLLLVWLQDFRSPFYLGKRIGQDGRTFRMVKIRSMVADADRSDLFSTSASDRRITPIGRAIRRTKIDELGQLWNVLKGEMSLVGPRPNVSHDVELYTEEEGRLLSAKPGITDFASIVFSDEGEILKGASDPDLAYNQRIRPWKSRLGLLYVDHGSLRLDLQLLLLTALAVISKPHALRGTDRILERLGAPEDVRSVARRETELAPCPPPGTTEVFAGRAR